MERQGRPDELRMQSAGHMSPEETLRIRRLLTLYLASLITFPDAQPSHFQLCHPETALEVESIPKQVIGLRRQYLKAIQANITARQTYQDLLASAKRDSAGVVADGEVGERLETHLTLLQMRKRLKEVQITHHYLEKLKETNPAKDGSLDFGSGRSHADEMSYLASVAGGHGAGSVHGDSTTEALTKKLERAVLRAKHQLEREKGLLAEVKARHAKGNSQDRVVDPRAQIDALSVTRDELVRFLEEKMSSASLEDDDDVPAHATEHGDELPLDPEQVHEQINAEYDRYIAARKRVLEAAAKALFISPETGSKDTISVNGTKGAENRARPPPPATGQSTLSILPFISEQVLPLLQNQKSTALQKSYTAKVLNAERLKALDSLDRLADESHLLPAYPMMARHERFKNVAAALRGSRKLDQAIGGQGEEKNEMTRRAEAWAFAAEEAKKAEEDFAMEKVRYGNERLNGAGESLAVLEELLGGDPQDPAVAGHDGGEPDIWLEAAGAAMQEPQSRRARPSEPEKGPWAGLNGKIGVVDGKKS